MCRCIGPCFILLYFLNHDDVEGALRFECDDDDDDDDDSALDCGEKIWFRLLQYEVCGREAKVEEKESASRL